MNTDKNLSEFISFFWEGIELENRAVSHVSYDEDGCLLIVEKEGWYSPLYCVIDFYDEKKEYVRFTFPNGEIVCNGCFPFKNTIRGEITLAVEEIEDGWPLMLAIGQWITWNLLNPESYVPLSDPFVGVKGYYWSKVGLEKIKKQQGINPV